MNSLDKLLLICDIEGDEKTVGWRKRRLAMEEWIKENVIESSTELSVVNPKVFDTNMMDIVKERLTQMASEELTTYTKYEIKKNKIAAKLKVLKT